MQDARFLLDASPWFILVALLVGLTYALLLYWRRGPWPLSLHRVLTALRFIIVSLLCFLLLGPLLRQIENQFEDPTIVIALDDSSSLAQVTDSTTLLAVENQLSDLGDQLSGDFKVVYRSLSAPEESEDLNPVGFSHPESPLATLLSDIKADYEGRNLAAVVLASDGIYNQGTSPTFETYAYPIHTLGLGDTLPKRDLNLKAVYYNQIAYQGNRFPLVVEITNEGFAGATTQVQVLQRGQVIASQSLSFSSPRQVQEVQFLLDATEEGLQRYTVRVATLTDEFTTQNNQRSVYLDIVEGREKVLIAAASPHPDIKAIRAALEKNANYEITTFIPGLDDWEADKYDVVILHQLPSARIGIPVPVRQLLEAGASTWFIWGPQTNMQAFNQLNNVLEVGVRGNQKDQVTPIFQPNFSRFRYSDENQGLTNRYPPVTVPFGGVSLKNAGEILFNQRVGSIDTNKPLWVFSTTEENKQAVTLGSGMWQWRLQEYARTTGQAAFDELVSKTVQYLSSKEDRRKFKVYPVANEFTESQAVILETEVYNDIYEEVYDKSISLTLSKDGEENTNYTYTTSAANTRYRISGLEEGIYQFSAATSVDGEVLNSTGAFTVKDLQLESLDLTANHALLRTLSEDTGGLFTTNLEALASELTNTQAQALIHSSEQFLPLVNLPWVFFLVLVLLTIEWVLRRYYGSY